MNSDSAILCSGLLVRVFVFRPEQGASELRSHGRAKTDHLRPFLVIAHDDWLTTYFLTVEHLDVVGGYRRGTAATFHKMRGF